jgi:hypothetical protein
MANKMDDREGVAEGAPEAWVILPEVVFEELDEPVSAALAQTEALEGFGEDIAYTQALEGCWSLGPLRVCASVVGSGEIRVTASLFGRRILSGSLNPSRPRLCASANVGIARAGVCLVLDVRGRRVRVEGRLCIRRLTWRWRCTRFNARVLSW